MAYSKAAVASKNPLHCRLLMKVISAAPYSTCRQIDSVTGVCDRVSVAIYPRLALNSQSTCIVRFQVCITMPSLKIFEML